MDDWMHAVMAWLALPSVGLPAVFVISLISATLLPLGSEPAVMALVTLEPDLFWQTIAVATVGNTLGGAISWWMGYGAERWMEKRQGDAVSGHELRALGWLRRFGPKACLLSWLPAVGDPLCAVAGWLKLPFWPCVAYMAVGKFVRYALYTAVLMGLLPYLTA